MVELYPFGRKAFRSELDPILKDSGFRLITDTRIVDMRGLSSRRGEQTKQIVGYRRMQVRRVQQEDPGLAESDKFRIQQFALTNDIAVRCDATELRPIFRIAPSGEAEDKIGFMCEAEFDLSGVPSGQRGLRSIRSGDPGSGKRQQSTAISDHRSDGCSHYVGSAPTRYALS